ncbi:hypothetical protein OQZ33_04280 [Pedobacter sp. MC2016-05]|uniref:hypothetical protein n=1 Tax=Pedobacter sp. MC2016-05 TaxID=2994474 RepID=UPI0022478D1B|nr:hypothetical protein [Pedobacter sp. MC2016-05]MCX2473543.1 hypothetical protein [Pedobacter sp. MC2016-05]
MAKLTLKGFVKEVGTIETVGDKATKKQTIIFFIPGYVDQFGDKKGRDEHWPLDVMGDNIAKLNITKDAVEQKAEVIVYVSGNIFQKKDLAGNGYAINANLAEIKLLGKATNAPAGVTEEKAW